MFKIDENEETYKIDHNNKMFEIDQNEALNLTTAEVQQIQVVNFASISLRNIIYSNLFQDEEDGNLLISIENFPNGTWVSNRNQICFLLIGPVWKSWQHHLKILPYMY